VKNASRMILTGVFLVLLLSIAVARTLGAREAQDSIAQALGITEPGRVHIKSIKVTTRDEAVVDATFDGAFHLSADKNGNWAVTEVRTGDRCWESVELIKTAIRKEKILRTTADLRAIATALDAFRREHGSYVKATTAAALMDNLAPRYMERLVRLDAWSHEFQYDGGPSGYKLASLGPDGKPDTEDDIVYRDGKLVRQP
jgi:hypothetical protein